MGNAHSNAAERNSTLLREDQRSLIRLKLFGNSKETKQGITRDMLMLHWSPVLGAALSQTFVKFLFPAPARPNIDFDEFLLLYKLLTKESNEKRSQTLLRLLDGSDTLSLDRFVSFVSEMWSAYVRMNTESGNSRLLCWTEGRGEKESFLQLASFLTKELSDDEEVGAYELESWLFNNTFTADMMTAVVSRMYYVCEQGRQSCLLPEPVFLQSESTVLSFSEVAFLSSSLPKESVSRWRKLFSIDDDGASWTTLVSRVLHQGPTLVLIEDASGDLFGGYASQSWRIGPSFYGDENTFLFTLRPALERFDSTGYNGNYQYINQGQQTLPNGLAFGGQFNYWGLFVDSQFGSGSVSESCSTFRSYEPLTADREFRMRTMEVWAVGEPDPTPEQLGERRVDFQSTSVLSQDPGAEAILEAAGKEFHSKAFREPSD